MDVILLAAGYATRLYPLTLNTPKPLSTVGGKAIIQRILEKLDGLPSIGGIYIVTNDKFYATFKEWVKTAGLKAPGPIEIVNDGTKSNDDRLGAIGDIRHVIKEKSLKGDILVIGGDNIFEFFLGDFVEFSKAKGEVTAAFYDIKDKSKASLYGVASIDDDRRVTDFEEKPKMPKSTLISTCVYYFPKERLRLLDDYSTDGNSTDATGNFIRWVFRRHTAFGYAFSEKWYDIGDKASLEIADKDYHCEK